MVFKHSYYVIVSTKNTTEISNERGTEFPRIVGEVECEADLLLFICLISTPVHDTPDSEWMK
jgi:hypothetical protein